MRFSGIFVLSSIAVSVLAYPLADVVVKIKGLTTQISTLKDGISALPDHVTGPQVLALHNAQSHLFSDLNDFTKSLANAPPFNAADSHANFVAVKDLESSAEAFLHALASKAAALSPVKVAVHADLQNFEAAANAWEDKMLSLAYKDDVAPSNELKTKLAALIDATLALFK